MWLKKKLKQVQLDKFTSSFNAKYSKFSAKFKKENFKDFKGFQ